MAKCSREECTGEAVFQPVLVLVAIPGTAPAEITLSIGLCEAHAVELDQPGDYLTRHGWLLLREEFIQRGFVPPSRGLTTVRMVSVESAEVH